jgi:diguanylate cyclase (GGDEF)-like protein
VLLLEGTHWPMLALALITGVLGGWFLRSRFGRRSLLHNRPPICGAAARIDDFGRAGNPAPFVVDQTIQTRPPVEGQAAPSVRNTFSIALDRHLPESARRGDPLSVLLVRIDNGRDSRDRHGLRSDDMLIEAVGKVFVASVRSTDWLARFDMTTFAFLLPGTAHGNTLIVAERLREALAAADLPCGAARGQLTLSIGTTEFVLGDSSASILRRAEEAMTAAVRAGGDCVRSQFGGQNRENVRVPLSAPVRNS